MELPDKVASEAAWAEANTARGPHSLIRQPAMRMFWWRCFGTAEEVAWETFWTRFPKDLERHAATFHSLTIAPVYCVTPTRQRTQEKFYILVQCCDTASLSIAPGTTAAPCSFPCTALHDVCMQTLHCQPSLTISYQTITCHCHSPACRPRFVFI